MWQWLNHTNSASSDHGFPWQELRFFSTDIWSFDEIPQCSRTWNSQRFHFMCQRMTHYFHRQFRTQVQETSVLLRSQIQSSVRFPRVPAWKPRCVGLADVAGVYSEASPLESQYRCNIGWFCVSRNLHPCAFHPLGYKTHRFQPTHLPKRADSEFWGISSDISMWMCWENNRLLCPVEMDKGNRSKAESVSEKEPLHAPQRWHNGVVIRLGQPWYTAWRCSVRVQGTSGGTITMGRRNLGDTAVIRSGYSLLKSHQLSLWAHSFYSFSLYFSP